MNPSFLRLLPKDPHFGVVVTFGPTNGHRLSNVNAQQGATGCCKSVSVYALLSVEIAQSVRECVQSRVQFCEAFLKSEKCQSHALARLASIYTFIYTLPSLLTQFLLAILPTHSWVIVLLAVLTRTLVPSYHDTVILSPIAWVSRVPSQRPTWALPLLVTHHGRIVEITACHQQSGSYSPARRRR